MLTKISTGNTSFIRHQQLLTQIISPGTLSLLEKAQVRAGSRVMSMNCGEGNAAFHLSRMVGERGIVVGFDPNAENIHTAQQLTEIKNGSNITFLETTQSRLSWAPLDLVHCYISLLQYFDLGTFIEEIQRLLKPGGVALFEVIDFSGFTCFPKNFAFERFIEICSDYLRNLWGDTPVHLRLCELLLRSHFDGIRHQFVAPFFLQNSGKQLPMLTLESIKGDVLNRKLSSNDEIQALLYNLTSLSQEPHALISLPGVHQIWGYRA